MSQQISPLEVKNILVVIFKYHGDVLLSSPVFSALKEAFPYANIDAYLYKNTLPILEGHPAIRDFFAYDQDWKELSSWQRIKQEAAQMKAILHRGYDLTINLTRGDRGAIASRVAKARYRVGFETDKGMAGQKHLYTHLVKWSDTKRHTVERNLDTLRILGIHPSWQARDLVMQFSFKEKAVANALLEQAGLEEGGYVLIHPVSRACYKNWTEEKWAEIIKNLLERNEKVALSGGFSQQELLYIDRILHIVGDDQSKIANFAGKTSLKELGVLIDFAKLLVCLDSVPLHIASAVKAKTVALFGPSCEKTWGPWRNPHALIVGMPLACRGCDQEGCGNTQMSDCMNELSVELVYEAIEKQLLPVAKVPFSQFPASFGK
ncbi:MAG: putative lipopolysaccharide heptosyltransferase III [Chlamydiae bacterium]|nr:putative lipopolysaccharide heptosyltransferase III [Chlamydiota bacterium]